MATYKVKFRTKDSLNPFQSNEEFITAGSREEAERVIKRRYGSDLTYVHASLFSEEFLNGGSSGSTQSARSSGSSSNELGCLFSIGILAVFYYGSLVFFEGYLPEKIPMLDWLWYAIAWLLKLPIVILLYLWNLF